MVVFSPLPRQLREVAWLFLKLGTIAFGGPAAHIAMMEDEVVRRRKWLTREEFLDLLGATNLIPGPNSTEMAIHIGHRRAGWWGLIVGGCCFILPAMLIVMACGWVYVRYGKIPEVEAVLYGVKPAIIAIVFQALWGLAKSAIRTKVLGILAVAVVGLGFFGVNELVLLFGAGTIVATCNALKNRGNQDVACVFPLPWLCPLFSAAVPTVATSSASASFAIWPLLFVFLKIGSVLYGSGYVLLAFLRSDLVERFGWLTETQLLDAVAIGQITPGPVFTTATFIGYILGGTPSALVATVGIFLPAFFFVAVSGRLVPRVRRSPVAGAFLDGVNAASLALMALVTIQLTHTALVDGITVLLAMASGFMLIRCKVNSAWLVGTGGLVGLLKVLVH